MPPKSTDRIDELEEAWVPERGTAKRVDRIVSSGPPVSYPPPSTDTLIRHIRAWLKANAWIVALFGIGSTTGMVTPWRDWLGLATKAELQAEAKRNDDARRALEAKQREERRKAREEMGRAVQECRAAQSQAVGAVEVSESVLEQTKRRRR